MATNNAINSANPIGVASGGTGNASATAYAVLCGGTTSTAAYQSIAGLGSSGNVLTSNGAGALPTFQAAASGGISTINGDSGSVTGSTVTLTMGASNANGTAVFSGSSATMTLNPSDASGNTGWGSLSVGSSATLSGSTNTCFGFSTGKYISSAGGNTFVGSFCGRGSNSTNMTSSQNVGIGSTTLENLTTGSGLNVSIGFGSCQNITTGAHNTIVGGSSGSAYTSSEESNILLGYNIAGTAAETHVLRIGNGTGNSSTGNINSTFISGITGITVTGTAVLVSSGNQLGIAVSSQRFKLDVQDMKDASDDIYKLRPVTFVWDKNSAPGLADAPDERQPGLIAEEVYKTMPHLVALDNDKKPLTVKYELLIPLLLNEVQRLQTRLVALEAQ